jgi:transcriptional regulator with XRE-family HTH domain
LAPEREQMGAQGGVMSAARDDVAHAFGDALKALRANAGLSKQGLFDRSHISALEAGKHNPSLLTVLRVAESFNVEPGLLVRTIARQLRRVAS